MRMITYTWNMEHGRDRWTYLNKFVNAQAICIQEISTFFATRGFHSYNREGHRVLTGMHRIGSEGRGVVMHIYILYYGKTGMNSVAVMVSGMHESRTRTGCVRLINAPYESERMPESRAAIGIKHENGVWVYSIHAPSSGASPKQLQWIRQVLRRISEAHPGEQWMCAGDFNADPDVIQLLIPPGSFIARTLEFTYIRARRTGRYDFAVYSPRPGPDPLVINNTAELLPNYTSDHHAVKFT